MKKLEILNSPQVLVIHISRFDSGLQKIDAFVKFPTELTTEYIRSGNGQVLTYRLRGLIVHQGPSIAEGHYIAYVLIPNITRVTRQRLSRLKAYILVYQS